jgi:hypothetical protein
MSQVRALIEQPTAVRRALLVPEQLADWVPSACAVVGEHLRHHGIAPTGFPFARCHALPDGLIEAEAGFPVAAPVAWAQVKEGIAPDAFNIFRTAGS